MGNQCWDPQPKTQWLISIRNFYLYLYPVSEKQDTQSSTSNASKRHKQSMGSAELHIRDSTHLVMPYLTVHSPMLGTCMRTTVGRRVKTKDSKGSTGSVISSSGMDSQLSGYSGFENKDPLLCYKFNTKQF